MPEISSSAHREFWHRADRVKTCTMCGEEKALGEFYAYAYTTNQGKPGTRYESRCRPCAQARRREQTKSNPGLNARQSIAWRTKNQERAVAVSKAYRTSEHGRAMKAYHQRLRKARLRSGADDNDAIRAIYVEAMEVEKLVACCPVFDIPELGKRMQVDHITPLSRGGKHIASNLQILPIGINMRKGNKCPR